MMLYKPTTKIKVFLIITLLLPMVLAAQGFDAKLEDLAKDLAEKINSKKITKVAVWGFFSDKNVQSNFGKYLTEDFSIYLVNHSQDFSIIDRTHLNVILKEHRLNASGYIDEKTTKRLGKIIAADAVVIGSYTIFNSEVKIRVKVLDTESALQIAGVIGTLPMNENIAKLLGKL